MMKIALVGQDIPTLLPTFLTDLLFAGKEAATVAIHEGNPAMQEVLSGYGAALVKRSGLNAEVFATGDRWEVLEDADCVIYAGDVQAASRFRMDREALMGVEEDDPGLTNQARVNGGLGGLMHTLRNGDAVQDLCEEMLEVCPEALVINLGQPVARTTEIFQRMGFRCYGLGRSPIKGANGVDTYAKKLGLTLKEVTAQTAGLPGFAFLTALTSEAGEDLLPQLTELAADGKLGRLTQRWLDWYGALPVGDVTDHGEFLPEQEDFIPEEEPTFGETVEQRKERILHMNTVKNEGASSQNGAMAQVTLLSKAPPIRPIQLALALLRGEDALLPAVVRRNGENFPQLPSSAIVEGDLLLRGGAEVPLHRLLPGSLPEVLGEIAEANHLSAMAAMGDRESWREVIEMDPALAGLDRLYCQELAERMLSQHLDIVKRL